MSSYVGKTMARIQGDKVVNLEWYSASQEETEFLKNVGDMPVGIGDTYIDGVFYHQGSEIKPPLEAAYDTINDLQTQLANSYTAEEVESAYTEGVNEV